MLKVKVCGMKDPVNTEAVVDAGPDFIGYIFYPPSKRYVGRAPDETLFSKVPPSILKTGVFVDGDITTIAGIVRLYGLNIVQLHGSQTAKDCDSLKKEGLVIIKAFKMSDSFNFCFLNEFMSVCDYFLFDSGTGSQGGSGLKFDWRKLSGYHIDKPFFLSGGIGPEDASVIRNIDNEYLFAVDINSGFEKSPGIKDSEKVKRFIKEIKESGYGL
jgi:phosphoribosylanthranilate isomerase